MSDEHAAPAAIDLARVRFLGHHKSYNAGEVAAFHPDQVKVLTEAKVAVAINEAGEPIHPEPAAAPDTPAEAAAPEVKVKPAPAVTKPAAGKPPAETKAV